METDTTIVSYMTKLPFTIDASENLLKAEKLMDFIKARHLPVVESGKLIGIVSERDIMAAEKSKEMDPSEIKVSDAFSESPYVVSANAPLAEVCEVMAQNKYGSALIAKDNKIIGIFTWIDALHALSTILKRK